MGRDAGPSECTQVLDEIAQQEHIASLPSTVEQEARHENHSSCPPVGSRCLSTCTRFSGPLALGLGPHWQLNCLDLFRAAVTASRGRQTPIP